MKTNLCRYVWPWAKKMAFIHDSYTCKKFSYTHPFPTKRKLGVGNYVGELKYKKISQNKKFKYKKISQNKNKLLQDLYCHSMLPSMLNVLKNVVQKNTETGFIVETCVFALNKTVKLNLFNVFFSEPKQRLDESNMHYMVANCVKFQSSLIFLGT